MQKTSTTAAALLQIGETHLKLLEKYVRWLISGHLDIYDHMKVILIQTTKF